MSNQDYLILDDARLFYTVSGKGDPLILLHGNFNDLQIWNEFNKIVLDFLEIMTLEEDPY